MSVYSNCDHELDKEIVKELKENPGEQEQHAAWDFCGYISWNGKQWENEIWRHNYIIEVIKGDEIMNVINDANDKYGSE